MIYSIAESTSELVNNIVLAYPVSNSSGNIETNL